MSQEDEIKDLKEQLEIAFEMSDMKEAVDKMLKKLREENEERKECLITSLTEVMGWEVKRLSSLMCKSIPM
jgi:PII-like signaling protein